MHAKNNMDIVFPTSNPHPYTSKTKEKTKNVVRMYAHVLEPSSFFFLSPLLKLSPCERIHQKQKGGLSHPSIHACTQRHDSTPSLDEHSKKRLLRCKPRRREKKRR
jgi:hypothetical protein